jgi:outer membrane protein assembly factor BamB
MPSPPARRPPAGPPSRGNVPRHAAPARFPFRVVMLVLILVAGVAVGATALVSHKGKDNPQAGGSTGAPPSSGQGTGSGTPTTPAPTDSSQASSSPGSTSPPGSTSSPGDGVFTPAPINSAFPGLVTFRGNATRDYYGEGPLPKHPKILWEYPQSGGLCSTSSDLFGTRTWCGTGWTGQPNVIVHKNGTIEVREGAYDRAYHFWNGLTGQPMRPDLVTGDLAKGSATSDSDGYPLYYGGSRDNNLRVIALDRPKPTVLWEVNADTSVPDPRWNNDWDGAPLQIGDYLLEGGENSWFYVIRLNRHYDSHHLVQVNPKIVMTVPGWDSQFLAELGDGDISIENSVAFYKGVVYFSNSGGLVQGWDISDILKGGTHYKRVFRFWDGDDTDASIVIDPQGYLYVSRHVEENVPRSTAMDHKIGGLMKLDPRKPNNPLVWSVPIGSYSPDGGSLSTPALYDGVVYDAATNGEVIAVNQQTGKLLWSFDVGSATLGSPVTIDHQLVLGDCQGVLHDWDISKKTHPPKELWHVQLSGCIESTPAVWHGMLWVGARGGKFYAIGDAKQ